MRIAMIQMASASGDVERNISRAFSMMEEAAGKSDLLVLPELWTIGYNFHHFEEHILSRHAALIERLSDFARTHRVTLSPGTLPVPVGAASETPASSLRRMESASPSTASDISSKDTWKPSSFIRGTRSCRRRSMASRRGWPSAMSSISRKCGEKWRRPGRPSS